MIAFLEGIAARIGLTIDSTLEALLWITVRGQAQINACGLSEYAQDVFRVVCDLPT